MEWPSARTVGPVLPSKGIWNGYASCVQARAVVSKRRRARASMRSFLRKFQRLSGLKYPLNDLPEEEGNPAVPWRTCDFVSVGVSIYLTDYSAGRGHWEARSCCPGTV